MLGVGVPTLQSAQISSPPRWLCLALSRDMPYCIVTSVYLPMLLHGRGPKTSDQVTSLTWNRDKEGQIS